MPQLSPGAVAPDFELADTNGKVHKLSDAIRSGPLVLVFYKSSCPTCQFTLPFIQQIEAKAGNQAGRIWGISQDDLKESVDFAKHFGFGFKILIDEHPYPVSSAYGLEYVPAIFIVNPDGKIGLSDMGFSKDALKDIADIAVPAGPMQLFAPDDKLPSRRPG
jgi:peroxiredoxin